MEKKRFKIILSVLLLTVLLYSAEEKLQTEALSDSVFQDSLLVDAISLDSLFYAADSASYFTKAQLINLEGAARIDYHSSSITADTIEVRVKDRQAFTLGESVLEDKDQLALGNEIYYDMDSQTGLIDQGAARFEKGYYYGDEMRKIGKQVYDVDNGLFTTCDALHPHFYIKTKQMRLYQNDKVVGKPVIFYVNHMPVFALPYGIFSVKRGRKMGILIPYPGQNSSDGKYVKDIAFYYPFKDYADIILGGDIYERTGWEAHLQASYLKRYVLNGNTLFRLRKRQSSLYSETYEWYLREVHHQQIGRSSYLDANITYTSSEQILENEEDANDRLAEDVTSTLSYKTPLFGSTLTVSGKLVADLMEESEVRYGDGVQDTLNYKLKTITLPSVSWSKPSRPLYEYFVGKDSKADKDAWYTKFSGSYNFRGNYKSVLKDSTPDFADIFWEEKEDSLGVINQHDGGMKHSTSLRYSNKYKGWLTYSESMSYNFVWLDEDSEGKKNATGRDWKLSTSANFNMYGIRSFKRGYLQAVRHIISPKVSYSYQPDFTENENLSNLSGMTVSKSDKQQRVSLSLGNTWQLKLRGDEEKKAKNINDFFKISSGISYDFENKNTGNNEGRGFSSLSHSLDLNPDALELGFMDFSVSPSGKIVQDTYDWQFKGNDLSEWDWGVTNWNLSVNSSLGIKGDAVYTDYFPLEKNPFTSNRFITDDSLSVEEEDEQMTLAALEELEREESSWSLSITHSYRLTQSGYEQHDYTSNLKGNLSLQLTKNWNLSYSNYYDLNKDEMVSQSFTLIRDLHCWQLEFRYSRQQDWWNYSFKLFNIKLPDSLIFKTSDSG